MFEIIFPIIIAIIIAVYDYLLIRSHRKHVQEILEEMKEQHKKDVQAIIGEVHKDFIRMFSSSKKK